MKKYSISFAVLEKIQESALELGDLMHAILSSGYGASYGKIVLQEEKIHEKRILEAFQQKEKKRFYDILYKLQKENLIKKDKKENKICITKKGREKFKTQSYKKYKKHPSCYAIEQGSVWTIVTFDIPEKQRTYRDWVRRVLQYLKFQMLQKSVWIGKTKIPASFVEDIYALKLQNSIEILEISKGGTLKQIT